MRWLIYHLIMIPLILADDQSSDDTDAHSPMNKTIQMIFTIPYSFSRESIVNETVVITNPITGENLPSIVQIGVNHSSVFIDYSTSQPFPHKICLFLLLNVSILREMIFCEMISQDSPSSDNHRSGPGVIFIVSQSVIILLMMFIIALGHKATQKRLPSRLRQYFQRTKEDPSTNFIPTPIEQIVIVTTDLTLLNPDRKYTSATLIDIKEFTKRMSASAERNEHEQF